MSYVRLAVRRFPIRITQREDAILFTFLPVEIMQHAIVFYEGKYIVYWEFCNGADDNQTILSGGIGQLAIW